MPKGGCSRTPQPEDRSLGSDMVEKQTGRKVTPGRPPSLARHRRPLAGPWLAPSSSTSAATVTQARSGPKTCFFFRTCPALGSPSEAVTRVTCRLPTASLWAHASGLGPQRSVVVSARSSLPRPDQQRPRALSLAVRTSAVRTERLALGAGGEPALPACRGWLRPSPSRSPVPRDACVAGHPCWDLCERKPRVRAPACSADVPVGG